MAILQQVIAKLTDLYRPFHKPSWPEELWPEPIEAGQFHSENMLRHGLLSDAMNMEFGVFQLLGQKYAKKAAYSWRPRERMLMEEISLAFYFVEKLRQRVECITANDKERLMISLFNYFHFLGENRSREDVRDLVAGYLSRSSLPDEQRLTPSTPFRVRHSLLDQLQQFNASLDRASAGRLAKDTLNWLDLVLDETLDASRYDWCTPLNVRTFASTGGDGHHFSLLVVDGEISEASPTVLTRPDYFGSSMVVAETLHEFLCLGCRGGYLDVMGQIPGAVTHEVSPDGFADYLDTAQIKVLRKLSERFRLETWSDSKRFQELQNQYQHLLILPPDVLL